MGLSVLAVPAPRPAPPRWSADNGADVINLSLGALPCVQALTLFCEDDIISTVPLGTGSAACGEEVERVLLDTARQPLTEVTGVYSPVFGWGIVDAAAATATPVTTAPAPTTGKGGKGGKGGGKPRR